MKKQIEQFYEFYKHSLEDILSFIFYFISKIIKFNLILIIVVIMLLIARESFSENIFSSIIGVIISIVAAVIFEGYRSYKKFVENNKIVSECYNEFNVAVSFFINMFLINTNVIHLSVIAGVDFKDLEKEKNEEKLKYLLMILEKFDNLKIVPKVNAKYNFENEEYEVGITVYQLYKDYLREYLNLPIERVLRVLVIYCEDSDIVKDFYELDNNIKDIIENEIWPNAFKVGQPCTTYFKIIKLTKNFIKILEKIKK